MTEFGQQLGKLRRACNDPDRSGRRLSQERLGELIGVKLGNDGFTGAAISEWERGASRIYADDRLSWPRLIAGFMRLASERFSISVTTIFWIWIGLLAWWLITPSLRWPFLNRSLALRAIGMYVVGTLIIPLLVGLLINTKDNEYWKQRSQVNPILLRLYTYQGAGIGFNIGYFLVFPLILIRYYLGMESSIWLELTAVTLGLILGNMSARVVPHNLWLAYDCLRLTDGAIFFVVALLGPLWGIFFMEYYSVLLMPFFGSVVVLVAVTAIVILGVRQSSKRLEHERDIV